MGIVQHKLIGVLRKAGNLLRTRLVETLLIKPDIQAASQHCGVRLQLLRIRGINFPNLIHVLFDPLAIETRLLQVLRGADKRAGLASNCRAQRAESTSCLRCKENQGLFRLLGDSDENPFFVSGASPGFDTGKPGIRRWIGRAPQEGDDHQIPDGLAIGQVRMQPQTIARLKVRNFRDGQGLAPALNPDLDFGANQIEGSIFCTRRTRKCRRDQEGADQNIGEETEKPRYESREAHYNPLTAGISGKAQLSARDYFK